MIPAIRAPWRPVSPNATFGIRDEDMPRLCPSAYRQQLDGNYELIDPADKPAGMPRKIRKSSRLGLSPLAKKGVLSFLWLSLV